VDERSEATSRPETTDVGVRRAFERSLAPGEIVFDEGDPGERLFVIQAGEVELRRRSAGGDRVERLGAGEFFGEMGVLAGGVRAERATALGAARLLELDAATLEDLCMERPEVAIRMLRRLAARLVDREAQLAALGGDGLRALVRVLVHGAEAGRDGLRVPTNLLGLAAQSGLSPLEAWRVVHQLLDRRLVRLVDDVLRIPDLEALAASAD
jgi:CRP-like cAMP-binding protein